MIDVPERFRPHIKVEYPDNNKQIFEEWFYNQIQSRYHCKGCREYLPIFWTSYYVNHNYGNDHRSMQALQEFINSLDKSKKYFTIVQYDDGILNDISALDIKVFGMGGGRIDYPLPLLCMPHPYEFDNHKDIFANFAGSLTHQIRRDIKNTIRRDIIDNVIKTGYTYYCPDHRLRIDEFCCVLSRSIFTIAPRGYGETSFRIMEALQFGSIPVYVSDKHIVPHNIDFNSYGVLIHQRDTVNIDYILKSINSEEIKRKQEAIPEIFKSYYTYESNMKLIINNAN